MARTVEIFIAGCEICTELVELVRSTACPSCTVTVHNMHDATVVDRAREIGVRSVPALVVNGAIVRPGAGGYDRQALLATGIGSPS